MYRQVVSQEWHALRCCTIMANRKSLDNEINVICLLLRDVANIHEGVFTPRSVKLTEAKLLRRYEREGKGLLSKTLPRLAKALDRALTGDTQLDCGRERKLKGTQLPMLFGELFKCVFSDDGWVLPAPKCNKDAEMRALCVASLRQLLLAFYKYEWPYDDKLEQQVLLGFKQTDHELEVHNRPCSYVNRCIAPDLWCKTGFHSCGPDQRKVGEKARSSLEELFRFFDPKDIVPCHGPGSVSTKEREYRKWKWTNIPSRLTEVYALDEYFFASVMHLCDNYHKLSELGDKEVPAKIVLVPKDSRGPRTISMESLPMQWIQQGLMRAIVYHVEHHPLTKDAVHFTDQVPNQKGALLGSRHTAFCRTSPLGSPQQPLRDGLYATLDLKEASDRVSQGLVHLLFPDNLKEALFATRSLSTVLPNGEEVKLNKFAPMGSAVCFPILALTIWSILDAAAPDADTRERILVYGDDVVVPTAYAEQAIKQLESFGLKVNVNKSCTRGFFRESCGVDAFLGHQVTPVKFKTVWTSSHSPECFEAWLAYANNLFDRRMYRTYEYIVSQLEAVYGPIPDESTGLNCATLRYNPLGNTGIRSRTNVDEQKLEHYVWCLVPSTYEAQINPWSEILRWFTEGRRAKPDYLAKHTVQASFNDIHECVYPLEAFEVRVYTERRSSKLVRRWR